MSRVLLTFVFIAFLYSTGRFNFQNLYELAVILVATYIIASFVVIIVRGYRKFYLDSAVVFDLGGVVFSGEFYTEEIFMRPGFKELLRELRKNRLVGVCSNLNWEAYKLFERKFGLDEIFDVKAVSGRYGVTKPNAKIYQMMLKELRVKADKCVFVDDHEENLPPAANLGIHAIQFRSVPELREELKRLGFI
ncbi:MAG: HAD-IA family hydrolase [archaeon]